MAGNERKRKIYLACIHQALQVLFKYESTGSTGSFFRVWVIQQLCCFNAL